MSTKLTDIAIRKAKAGDNPYKLFDGGGLFLLVSKNRAKGWRLKYRFEDKEKLLSLCAPLSFHHKITFPYLLHLHLSILQLSSQASTDFCLV